MTASSRRPLTSPVERAALSIVGYVDEVSPARIAVRLTHQAPRGYVLGNGAPMGFPKLNGYVLIPAGTFDVVGVVTWMGAKPEPAGPEAADLVELPIGRTLLHLLPVGILEYDGGAERRVTFQRGIPIYPSVGDAAHLPTSDQLDAITAPNGEAPHIRIGRATIGSNPPIKLDPTLAFGHHLAVLGNTGSGKSCTVATLVRNSIQAAAAASDTERANTRFIVLDPNGEYSTAFADLPGGVRVLKPDDPINPLQIPAWMWSGAEWASLARAQAGTQHPILMSALRALKAAGSGTPDDGLDDVRYFATDRQRACRSYKALGSEAFGQNKNKFMLAEAIKACADKSTVFARNHADDTQLASRLTAVATACTTVLRSRKNGDFWHQFDETDFDAILEPLTELRAHVGAAPTTPGLEDAPIRFTVQDLPTEVENLAAEKGQSQYVDTMALRLDSLIKDTRCRSIIAPENPPSVEQLLTTLLGGDGDEHPVVVIDLSLVPTEIVHVIAAAVCRLAFEGLQRLRTDAELEAPTVLVLEEAHTFVRDTQRDQQDMGAATLCRSTVERVAREGRKFGLGLLVSSQRPSELAPTALSQCNTFLLHRLVNDRDQELVRRLVPDAFGDLLRELPVLPTRTAALLGLAVSAPIMVEIDELHEDHRPRSNNPAYWQRWIAPDTELPWDVVVRSWAGHGTDPAATPPAATPPVPPVDGAPLF